MNQRLCVALTIAGGFCISMFAACAGSGGSVSVSQRLAQTQGRALAAQSVPASGSVAFSIRVTRSVRASRVSPHYVSASTQSLQILIDGANPVVMNIGPSSPFCSPDPSTPNSYICTASLNAPDGNHVFTVTAYDQPNATGSVLSTNSTGMVNIKPKGTNRISLVLDGVVQRVALVLTQVNPPVGTPATIGVTAILADADNNLIIGAAPFQHPVTLTTSDATDGPLSKTTLNSPADASGITLRYSGAKVPSITYSATATSLPAANVVPGILTPGAAGASRHLYATNQNNNTVSVFDLANLSAAPMVISGGGIVRPQAAAVDAIGRLYVLNGPSISVFDTAHENAVLPAITGNGLAQSLGMTIDSSGKLFVSNIGTNSISVFDTAHGNAALAPITGGGLDRPLGLTIDANGRLYVVDDAETDPSVSVFDTAHGNVALPKISGGLDDPIGDAIDASGRLYVVNGARASASVFDTAHGNAVLPTISGGGLLFPQGAALDAAGKLYVTNSDNNTISIFDTAHGDAALPQITTGLHTPTNVTVH